MSHCQARPDPRPSSDTKDQALFAGGVPTRRPGQKSEVVAESHCNRKGQETHDKGRGEHLSNPVVV